MRAPIRGVGDETNPRGRRQTRRPPQRQTPDRLGASQACLKTPTAKIRKTRAPRTARIEPNKCPSGPKLGQNKTTAARDGVKNRRSRGASAKLRRRRAPDGREKSAANAVAPSLGNRSESALFRIAQKPTRSAGRESPAPILAKPGAAIPTESLFLQCAADAANRPGWFSRPAPGRRTNPTRDAARNGRSPRRERLEQPSRKTTPKPNGKQAGGEWRVKRIARKAAPQGNRREKPPANSGRRQNHFRINAVNPRTCRRPRAASRPTAAATCQALKSKRCRQTPLRRTAKSLRLDLTATAKTISKKVGEGRAKPAGIIKQFALDYAANDPGRSAQNNARLPNARESPSAIKPNEMKPREARAGARISRRER